MFDSVKFDVVAAKCIFSDSSPEMARSMLTGMLKQINPGGQLILFENLHTALSSCESLAGVGRWNHAFAQYLDGLADSEIIDNFDEEHAIYIARNPQVGKRSLYRYRVQVDGTSEILDFESVLIRGLKRAAINSDNLLAHCVAADDGNASAAIKPLGIEKKSTAVPLRTADVREVLLDQHKMFHERQAVLEHLAMAVNVTRHGSGQSEPVIAIEAPKPALTEPLEWNAAQDTRYSHVRLGFESVLHVFHQEWFGIRAAAGSLPGDKLAVSASIELPHAALLSIYKKLQEKSYRCIVFHGISKNTKTMVEFLALRGLDKFLFLVVHGTVAQWMNPAERSAAFWAIDCLQKQKIRKLHFMKNGFRFPNKGIFRPMLFNISPKFNQGNPGKKFQIFKEKGAVFAPSWNDWRKNIYTNILAASLCNHVKKVIVHAPDLELPPQINHKLTFEKYSTRERTLELMAMSSLCLNVTFVDCHPMVNVEAQSLGRPCLRGNLFLDALESHPYIALTNVLDMCSVDEITNTIDKVLSVPEKEINELVFDYQAQSDLVSHARYSEFLEI